MLTIYKYPILPSTTISMPRGAVIRHVGEQSGTVYVWAEVWDDRPDVTRRFCVVGTGAEAPVCVAPAKFIGTVQMKSGLVWHVYDGGELG